jgi:hypothetical protein
MGVASTGHMLGRITYAWGSLVPATCLVGLLMHGGRWYRPHVLQRFDMGGAGTGHMFNRFHFCSWHGRGIDLRP